MRKTLLLCLIGWQSAAAWAASHLPYTDTGKIVCRNVTKPSENKAALRNAINLNWQKKGYLLARTDSSGPLQICTHTGPKPDSVWLLLPGNGTNHSDTILSEVENAMDILEAVLVRHENTGYPFAKARWVPVEESARKLTLQLLLTPGDFYVLDTVETGKAHFSNGFLRRAAGVKTGEAYNHSQMLQLQTRIAALEGFTAQRQQTVLQVENGKLHALLPVNKAARDQVNALVGVATNPDGKVLFTGEAMGRFYNLFKNGVAGSFEWRSFKARSQEMKITAGIPYLLGVPFITNLMVSLEKYDTLYTIFNRGFQLRFPLSARSSLVVGGFFGTRTRIFADVATVKNFRQLPDNPSSRNENFQLGFESSNLTPGEIPTKGYRIRIMGAAGFRRYVQDAQLAAITWVSASGVTENVYDSLKRTGNFRTPQYRLDYDFSGYIPLSRFIVCRLAASGFQFQAPVVYFNELTRFGGIKNVRGFNEQSIFANQMHSATAELHLIAGKAGYIGPFYNAAWFQNQTVGGSKGVLQGFGIVSGIKTGAGILQIIWAVGKTGQLPFALNNSKFHFGISNTF